MHISNVPQTRGCERKIAEGPPCVVLASPGFMGSGPSRELLELWAPDSRNGVIVTGYSIEGTMARVSGLPLSEARHVDCILLYVHYVNQCTCFPSPLSPGARLLESHCERAGTHSCP